jgi:hypothetical protein
MNWPLPISRRVDALADLVEESSGERPDRKDLVGALVLDAPTTAPDLVAKLATYRSAKAGDALRDGLPARKVLSTDKDPPGRRPGGTTKSAAAA